MKRKTLIFSVVLGLATTTLMGCDGSTESATCTDAPIGAGTKVFTVATDYATYEVERIVGSSSTHVENVANVNLGLVIDAGVGVLFVENQGTGEIAAFRDGIADKCHTVFDKNVGVGSNIYQVLQVGSRLFVDRFNRNDILVLDASNGDSVRSIDLSASVDNEGSVKPSRMAFAGGKLWILAQHLRADYSFDSAMVISVDTGAILAPRGVVLPTLNPQDLAATNGKMYVACHGTYDTVANGGIERLDLATGVWEATITGKLGGNKPVNSLVAVAGKLWTVIATNAGGTNLQAVPVDPVSGVFGSAAGGTQKAWSLASDGTSLWLADQSSGDQQSVMELDPTSGAVLKRVKTALPPTSLAVLR